ncbi:MAG: AAA family ATPase [Candidatus Paceibacterota bacterium]
MKTIILYGAPAVGKLTVAKELSKITGFELLHNHLINDLINVAADFGTTEFWKMAHKYRLDIIEQAMVNKRKGIILTFFYAKEADDLYLKKVIDKAKKHNGKIFFIHLLCEHKELFKRLKHPSRKFFKKLKDVKKLNEVIKKHEIFSDVPFKPNLSIDNTKISPKKVAKLIVEFIG